MKHLIVLALFSLLALMGKAEEKDQRLWKKALRIHKRALTIDTHCDTPMEMLKPGFKLGEQHERTESLVDLPRMKAGGLDALFFAVFTGQQPRTAENYRQTYQLAKQMLDSIQAATIKHADLAMLALTADHAERIAQTGKRAIYIGMENGFPLGKDLNRVQEFYTRGVRYTTLCHSFHNDICDSSSDAAEPEHHGVSDFGRMVIHEMNRLGMMVDVSHLSDDSFFDVMNMSQAPVIASHSSVRAICKHDRNMSDEMIKKLAEQGGVIQICLLDDYIKEPDTTTQRYAIQNQLMHVYRTEFHAMNEQQKEAFNQKWDDMKKNYPKKLPTVSDLVDHIDHVVNLVGVDYVGIGSDFDGGGGLADCADVSQFPNITYELLKRGYSERDIKKIWGENLIRVFREVEKTAGTLANN
ncbi:dipeptidase [Sunxiuqinia sp. sy24]|uniref:dipeptidase n=1 Tax=Sunxiuqinia sp. sy24 TaxID=3461495 RepID=UPI004045FBF0